MAEELRDTVTLDWLIKRLGELAAQHGGDTLVYIHDEDTDWSLPLKPETAARFGKDQIGYGEDDAVMLRSAGYH